MATAASLLFNIGAETGDAEGNITRFRSLLGKDLSELEAEFSSWANHVFGNLSTVQGGLIGVTAAAAAGLVALGGAAIEAAEKYEHLVEQIDDGSTKTGIGAEEMSKLKHAADITGTSYDALVRGLTMFQAAIVHAGEGSLQQQRAFDRMGISAEQLATGERNVIPLLEIVMDRMKGLASGTERASVARDLFGRGGSDMMEFLRIGSDGLRQMTQEAERLGIVITEKDVVAEKEHKAAIVEMKKEAEAFAVAIGREVLPMLEGFTVMMIGLTETVRQGGLTSGHFFASWLANAELAAGRIQRLVATMGSEGHAALSPAADGAKKAKDQFDGFGSILDSIRGKMAATSGEEAQIAAELVHINLEAQKAQQAFQQAVKDGTLSADAQKAAVKQMAMLPGAIGELGVALWKQYQEKLRQAQEQATADLQSRLTDQRERGFAQEYAAWDDEIAKLRTQYAKKGQLTTENEALIEQIHMAGTQRIRRDQLAAYEQELVDLQQHLEQMVTVNLTSQERIEFAHDQGLSMYGEVEEQKALLTAKSEQEAAIIRQQFALNRAAVDKKYQQDLQALFNSQGWQGVFGRQFAQTIRGNEALLREWATSSHQSLMMVRVAVESLGEMTQDTFDTFAQGMGANIAQAMVYSKSIKEAMQSATAAALEQLSARAMVEAIYSAALGFLCLAEGDFAGAAAAFEAAAIFGSVGVVAGLAGRAIAPKQGGGNASGGSSAGANGGSSASSDLTGSQAQQQPQNTLIVQFHGPVYGGQAGIDQLCAAISDAVQNRDTRLVATGTTSGQTVRR